MEQEDNILSLTSLVDNGTPLEGEVAPTVFYQSSFNEILKDLDQMERDGITLQTFMVLDSDCKLVDGISPTDNRPDIRDTEAVQGMESLRDVMQTWYLPPCPEDSDDGPDLISHLAPSLRPRPPVKITVQGVPVDYSFPDNEWSKQVKRQIATKQPFIKSPVIEVPFHASTVDTYVIKFQALVWKGNLDSPSGIRVFTDSGRAIDRLKPQLYGDMENNAHSYLNGRLVTDAKHAKNIGSKTSQDYHYFLQMAGLDPVGADVKQKALDLGLPSEHAFQNEMVGSTKHVKNWLGLSNCLLYVMFDRKHLDESKLLQEKKDGMVERKEVVEIFHEVYRAVARFCYCLLQDPDSVEVENDVKPTLRGCAYEAYEATVREAQKRKLVSAPKLALPAQPKGPLVGIVSALEEAGVAEGILPKEGLRAHTTPPTHSGTKLASPDKYGNGNVEKRKRVTPAAASAPPAAGNGSKPKNEGQAPKRPKLTLPLELHALLPPGSRMQRKSLTRLRDQGVRL